MRVLLASASPRRKNLLETVGTLFGLREVTVRPVDIDESERPGESAAAYLSRVVEAKLVAALSMLGDHDALLVADTTVDLDGQLLHKPVDDEDGRRMLRALSGRTHVVRTGFAIATARERHVEIVPTQVVFRALEEGEIERYVASGEGRDKAGGYGIQGLGAAFVSRIEGSYGAVVGLPSSEVVVALRRLCR